MRFGLMGCLTARTNTCSCVAVMLDCYQPLPPPCRFVRMVPVTVPMPHTLPSCTPSTSCSVSRHLPTPSQHMSMPAIAQAAYQHL